MMLPLLHHILLLLQIVFLLLCVFLLLLLKLLLLLLLLVGCGLCQKLLPLAEDSLLLRLHMPELLQHFQLVKHCRLLRMQYLYLLYLLQLHSHVPHLSHQLQLNLLLPYHLFPRLWSFRISCCQ